MPKTHYMLTLGEKDVGALKSLVRFHFQATLVKFFEQPLPIPGTLLAEPRVRALAIQNFVDSFDEVLEPLHFMTGAFTLTGTHEGTIPIRADIYSRLKYMADNAIPLGTYKGLTAEEIEAMIAPLRSCQEELRMLFNAAEAVDPDKLPRQHYLNVASTPRKPSGPPTGSLLN